MPKARWLARLHDELAGRVVAEPIPRRAIKRYPTKSNGGRRRTSTRRVALPLSSVLGAAARTLRSLNCNELLVEDCLLWAKIAEKHEGDNGGASHESA